MALATEAPPQTTLTVGSSSGVAAAETVKVPVIPAVAVAKVETPAAPVAAAPANKPQASLLADEAPATEAIAAPEVVPTDAPPSEIVYTLKAPEKSALTADDLKAVEAFARERKLSPEAAQAIVDRDAKIAEAHKTKSDAAAQASVDKIQTTWKEQSLQHPSLGGQNWKKTVDLVDRALVDEPELHALLKTSPLRFHPAVVGYLAKQGAKTREDQPPAASSAAATQTKSPSQRWFPKK